MPCLHILELVGMLVLEFLKLFGALSLGATFRPSDFSLERIARSHSNNIKKQQIIQPRKPRRIDKEKTTHIRVLIHVDELVLHLLQLSSR